MLKTLRIATTLALAAALLAVPATAPAAPGGQGKGKGKTKSCEKSRSLSYQLAGTLVSVPEDDATTTDTFEGTVTLLVTSANRHVRNSGEILDQDADRKGTQVAGATYTVPATDVFELKLNGYVDPDTPSAGDRVKVSGRIAVTKKRCAPEGTTTEDRYGTLDVRRVTISDRDEDVVTTETTETTE
jgi:hypothetical protein